MTVTVLYEGVTHEVAGAATGDGRLWLTPQDLAAATGWEWKPVGMCRGDACVPVPPGESWQGDDGRIDVTAFTSYLGHPVVHDAKHDVWAFGDRPDVRAARLQSLEAPEFTLPDLDNNLHSLSDYRGSKVFLLAWASY